MRTLAVLSVLFGIAACHLEDEVPLESDSMSQPILGITPIDPFDHCEDLGHVSDVTAAIAAFCAGRGNTGEYLVCFTSDFVDDFPAIESVNCRPLTPWEEAWGMVDLIVNGW